LDLFSKLPFKLKKLSASFPFGLRERWASRFFSKRGGKKTGKDLKKKTVKGVLGMVKCGDM